MLKQLIIQFSKFAGVGAFCAGVSLSANFILLKYFDTPLVPTYISIYLCSIFLSFILNSHFTYKSEKTLGNLMAYYTIYMTAMILGVFLLHIYEYLFDFEKWVYPFMVAPITMIWNFSYASKVLKPSSTLAL